MCGCGCELARAVAEEQGQGSRRAAAEDEPARRPGGLVAAVVAAFRAAWSRLGPVRT
jgi:hypothetical protein